MVVYIGSQAQQSIRGIFAYFKKVAGKKIAIDVRDRIRNGVGQLRLHPYIGVVEQDIPGGEYRSLVIHSYYKLIYKVENSSIYVIDVWDCRQNPDRMKDLIES